VTAPQVKIQSSIGAARESFVPRSRGDTSNAYFHKLASDQEGRNPNRHGNQLGLRVTYYEVRAPSKPSQVATYAFSLLCG
jgi:hypothetical protein